ncbi:sn-glycerol-3-phosphate ABC transporter ATP-binding protein UgpC [Agrobacterium rubi]|uniref:Putative ABC transporter ATP-binding protein n=1 Tax=Agrobacterium rubi TR3 = NBRC 13261 TaxID=1368415 RepID=A0A081CZJ4_9HYPH|nr:sn-glycerol-3-phosphate ABC transporter ATP-binding protein UgpC [Agrobacterium rubi]MBP1880408.1 multiple sugar transport system ATP-binding protein [Agrobacterium rubi]MCL6654587.1 sugar ABC transporter ATP-binding protein [Agrobacterium rubi]NTF08979.1 sn-glycerol-3-phosphate ABC transporter ATP-binding protein UgpC [Agrobacterium rubi]NTF21250.1 sn-glycerol-3-phosphate ABC transporter ATP-binding protein UgpC [Agrobacterium rubi]NTF28107.1 sn-glycerol-3-phosphate ABC transporter ATP-bin
MGAVSLRGVSKSFGAVDVIKDVSIDIAAGEFCVLIGPSGSGKSTLLRIIAGLEEASEGTIHIGNRDVTDLEPKERDIAMVFQSYALYPQMTVRENMSFSLRLANRPKDEIKRKIDDVAQMLDLGKLLDRLPKELSGGQRQRVAMGRAIVRNPAVFLFDEPLSNLDAKLRGQVRGEIRDLHHKSNTTSVYVTHDQVEAMTMGQKIVVLRDGRVEQAGTPLELYDLPDSVFVASFIGSPSINMLKAKVSPDGQTLVLHDSKANLPIPGNYGDVSGRDVLMGVRPEYLEIVPYETAGVLQAKVHAVETTGSDTTVICDTSVGQVLVSSKSRSPLHMGDQVGLSIANGKALLFDKATERRIVPLV